MPSPAIWRRGLQEVGAPPISHFGFSRERFRETLWRESAAWLTAQAAGA